MIDKSLSTRIDLLRTLMIFGVVVLHTPLYVPMGEVGSDAFAQVKAFFQQAFFRGSVPVLTAISGYLLFSAGLDQQPGKLARKKGRAILVPFLAFNLGLLTLLYGAHLAGVDLGQGFSTASAKEWGDMALGLTTSPVNYPLNFLRDMIVLLALAPLMGCILRTVPASGLFVAALIFMQNGDGLLILRNDMPIIFYVGGLAAVYRWNLRALDFAAWPLLGLFVALCAAWVALGIENTNALRYMAPLTLWPAASILADTKAGAWLARQAKYSFFVFLAHAPVLAATWMAYQKLGTVPYAIYWVVAPFATVGILIALHRAAMGAAPRAFRPLVGVTA